MAIATTSLLCLALVIHNESLGESKRGKAAVAHVVLNRAKSKNKICKTVHAPNQFYTKPIKNKKSKGWHESQHVAKQVLSNTLKDPTKGATYFHNHTVRPKWSKIKTKTTRIGGHSFYK
jgi:N-acetylmuramoyl-L-alanine amidase